MAGLSFWDLVQVSPEQTRGLLRDILGEPTVPPGRAEGLGLGRQILAELSGVKQPKITTLLAPAIGGAIAGLLARALGASDQFAGSLVRGATQAGAVAYEAALREAQDKRKALFEALRQELEMQRQLGLEDFRQRAQLAREVFLRTLQEQAKKERDKERKKRLQILHEQARKINWEDPSQSASFMVMLADILPSDTINAIQRHVATILRLRQQEQQGQAKQTTTQQKPPLTFRDFLKWRYPLEVEGLTPEQMGQAWREYQGLLGNLTASPTPQPVQEPRETKRKSVFDLLGLH